MNLNHRIAALAGMTTAELDASYRELFGQRPRYRSPAWLRKRIAFKLQENAHGGLPSVARAAIANLTADIVVPAAPPRTAATPPPLASTPALPKHGLRPGTVLQREWRGQRIAVEVTDAGIVWNGTNYSSLSAAAQAITGSKWNGRLFFGLVERSAKA